MTMRRLGCLILHFTGLKFDLGELNESAFSSKYVIIILWNGFVHYFRSYK